MSVRELIKAHAALTLEGMPTAPRGATCPMCGRSDGAHQHTPEEVTIYTNGMMAGARLIETLLKRPCEAPVPLLHDGYEPPMRIRV